MFFNTRKEDSWTFEKHLSKGNEFFPLFQNEFCLDNGARKSTKSSLTNQRFFLYLLDLPERDSVVGKKKMAPKQTKQKVANTRKMRYFSLGLKEAALLGPIMEDSKPPLEVGGIDTTLAIHPFQDLEFGNLL